MNKYIINEEETQIYPLTSYQKDVWVEQCLYKGQPIYNIGGYADVKGNFDYLILQKAIQKLIEDNDSLRIRIFENDGQPYQKILKELKYEVPFYDFSNKEDAEKFSLEWMQNEFLKPFNLDSDESLVKFVLIKVNDNRYFHFSKAHHIVTDGWGYSVLFKTVVRNYNNVIDSKNELEKYSYCEFIQENEKYRKSDRYLKDKQFWQNKFNNIPEALFIKGISSNKVTVSNRESMIIERQIYDKIIEFCKDKNSSVFHFFLGILAIYFGKVCDKENVVIGVPILNRTKANYKKVIGHFANVIPIKISISKEKTFEDLISEIKMELSTSYRHQKLSLGEIYNSIYEEKKESLFDITLSYEKHDYSTNFINTETDIKTLNNQSERNPLAIFIREFDDSKDVEINFDYSLEVFKKFIPVTNIIKHVESLIKESLNNCQKNIGDIDILSKEEKHKILYEFNDTEVSYPRNKTIYQLFEEQVEKIPENIAIIYEDKELTYRELNEKSNSLARVLREKGVKADTIVGIMVDRSIEMIVGIMGILKSGGAYLPIDPRYPDDRIEYMLEDSNTNILLTQKHLLEKVDFSGEIVDLDDKSLYEGIIDNLENINDSNNLAYVIYTSGSTGKPKGVMIEHKSLVNLLVDLQRKYPLTDKDTYMLKTNYVFDVSTTELFGWFFGGGKLKILRQGFEINTREILNAIETNNVTHINFVPSMLRIIMDNMTDEDIRIIRKLKFLFVAGEAISKELVYEFNNLNTGIRFENLYGPTEATVYATGCSLNNLNTKKNVPIGTPIANTKICILSKGGAIQPIGVEGELCILGDGLARGYLNRTKLTEEKFVANSDETGQRMYKTGDLARWLPDGNIEFIGRIDHQVKIRGFRIELGEIESQLLNNEEIKEVIVIDRKDDQGNKYLCAYMVSNRELTIPELRASLSKELPDYMIPAYFMQIDKMPLTPNGKIDRKALPQPDKEINTGVEFAAPRNEVEEKLVQIWSEVLGVEKIGIDDDFFALGGDSIKAIQISARLSRYKLKISVIELFANSTIRQLGIYVKQEDNNIKQESVKGEVELTAIQKWFFEQKFINMHHWNQAFMMCSKDGFDKEIVEKVFSKIVKHHDALRIVFQEKEGKLIQYNRGIENSLFDLSVIDLNNCKSYKEEIEKEANKIQSSINLSCGPLVKLGLFKTPDGDHLLIVIHHLVVDGVSWRIILEDFATGYRQALNDEKIELPEKTHSFKEWSDNIKLYSSSRELLEEIKYWKNLENTIVKELPKDYKATNNNRYVSSIMQMIIAKEDTESLLKNSNKAYNTEINDILLAALGLTIKQWTGENNVLVNIEGHGREEILSNMNITRTIGWFTSIYPVILNCEKSHDKGYYIKSIKESIRKIPNKGVGYGILKYITPKEYIEDLEFKLKPEISFNYLGQFDNDINHNEFKVSSISTGNAISKESQRLYGIDINGMIINGELVLNFEYNKEEYNENTIIELVGSYKEILLDIIQHCTQKEEVETTPSDFYYKEISIEELEDIETALW